VPRLKSKHSIKAPMSCRPSRGGAGGPNLAPLAASLFVRRNPHAQAIRIKLRRANVVEVTTVLVIGVDVGSGLPERRPHERGDRLALKIHARPPFVGIRGAERGEVVRRNQPSLPVGLRIAMRYTVMPHPRRIPVIAVEGMIFLAVNDDVAQWRLRRAPLSSARCRCWTRIQQRRTQRSRTSHAGPLQELATVHRRVRGSWSRTQVELISQEATD
jgi:hypothetical protein